MLKTRYLHPDCELPAEVRVAFTTRGAPRDAADPYSAFNLGAHVGDQAARVTANRRRLVDDLQLPANPLWLRQVHGVDVIHAAVWHPEIAADACWSDRPGDVCAVLTADCLPVVLAPAEGGKIAVAHAGWRGLAAGVLENTLAAMGVAGEDVIACFGPAIGPAAFEVRADVVAAFGGSDNAAFQRRSNEHWLADLYQLAEQRLRRLGVQRFSTTRWCTYSEPENFFSYRRDGQSGRMATLAWRVA